MPRLAETRTGSICPPAPQPPTPLPAWPPGSQLCCCSGSTRGGGAGSLVSFPSCLGLSFQGPQKGLRPGATARGRG